MSKPKKPVARSGCTVHFLHSKNGERTCILGKPKPNEARVPPDTPIGEVLFGSCEGDVHTIRDTDGSEITIRVIDVIPSRSKLVA